MRVTSTPPGTPQRRQSTVVDVFADVSCPFAHVGLRRFVEERDRRGRDDVVLHVRAWPLELVNGQPLEADLVAHHVAALRAGVAPDLFRNFDAASFPRSSLPALALAAAAYEIDDRVGEAVSLESRDALFEAGRDISDASVLGEIAARHGIDVTDPPRIAPVRDDWMDGQLRGVHGSPEFFIGGRGYFCPALDISRVDGTVYVARDLEGFRSFLAACFDG